MKTLASLLVFLFCLSGTLIGQDSIYRSLKNFHKIKSGFNVEVELKKGDHPAIQLEVDKVDPSLVVARVSGKTLKIFIKGQKVTPKKRFKDAKVRAVVTYDQLKLIAMKGEEDLVCKNAIASERFKLKLMGDGDVDIAKLEAGYLKGNLMGENTVRIRDGFAVEQAWRITGGATLQLLDLRSEFFWTRALGDCTLELQVHQDLDINLVGDAVMRLRGRPVINQTSIGEMALYRVD